MEIALPGKDATHGRVRKPGAEPSPATETLSRRPLASTRGHVIRAVARCDLVAILILEQNDRRASGEAITTHPIDDSNQAIFRVHFHHRPRMKIAGTMVTSCAIIYAGRVFGRAKCQGIALRCRAFDRLDGSPNTLLSGGFFACDTCRWDVPVILSSRD